MVKVIIERQVRSGQEEAFRLLTSRLRATAKDKPGYISGETLISGRDPNLTMIVTSWCDRESWDTYRSSLVGKSVAGRLESLLVEPEKVKIFEVDECGIHWNVQLPDAVSAPVV